MKIRTLLLVALGSMWFAATAQADPFDVSTMACPNESTFIQTSNVTGNTGGSDACFGAFNNNDPGPSGDGIVLNGVIYDFVAKSDIADNGGQTFSGANIGLNVYQPGAGGSCSPDDGIAMTGASSSGCWSYDSNLFSADSFMIVIKAASSPGWAAYLFDANSASSYGSWVVAWGGYDKDGNIQRCEFTVGATGSELETNCKNISHLSIYANNFTTVSEPGTLALLGMSMLGVGLVRRRRNWT